jgi:hypothetical protein
MKKAIALIILALAAAAPLATAQTTPAGINLYAFAGATGSACDVSGLNAALTSACSNVGTAMKLYSTVSIPRALVALAACGQTMDVYTENGATLPDWWKLDACRGGKTIATMNGSVTGCTGGTIWDPNVGTGPISVEAYTPDGSGLTGSMRMQMGAAVAAPFDVTPDYLGYELGVGSLQINNGPATCTGCDIGACIVLREVTLNEDGTANFPHMSNAIVSVTATWQTVPAGLACHDVPTKNKTWGAIKALYR